MTQSEFEHIAPELRSQMRKVALDFFGSQDDAEDVAQDAMSRHRGAKPLRRCELLGVISLLSPG